MRAIGPNSFPEEDNELLHTPLFKQVSPEQANELIPYLHEAVFDKGDYIFREGDRDHRMYLLERGRVKLIREPKDRRTARRDSRIRPVRRPPYRHGRGDDPRHARGMVGA